MSGAGGGTPSFTVAVFDYGAGNLHSLVKAIEVTGASVVVEPDPAAAARASAIVLPGVGAFGVAAERLAPGREAIREAVAGGTPLLGICLGMQLLLDGSEEGSGRGLGIVPGRVTRLDAARVPQIGWNTVTPAPAAGDPLFTTAPLDAVYYANSYVCRAEREEQVIAWSTHEQDRFPAAVRAGSAVGVQFHPEKSSAAGVRFVGAWVSEARRRAAEGGR